MSNLTLDDSHHSAHRPVADWLRAVPMFDVLSEAAVGVLAAISRLDDVDAGTTLFREDEPAEHLHILMEGRVTLSSQASGGRRAVVEVVEPVRHLVLATVLASAPYVVDAQAITDSVLISVPTEALHQLVRENAELASSLMRAQAIDFASMVREVCDLKMRTAAERLGSYLLELLRDDPVVETGFRLPIDKRLLAARLGCRKENLSRAFAILRDFGVETHGRRVILHDVEALRRFAFPNQLAAPGTA
jgi:CRP/FNR family transcriptional activator FtrB